jgi:hypothetical protein
MIRYFLFKKIKLVRQPPSSPKRPKTHHFSYRRHLTSALHGTTGSVVDGAESGDLSDIGCVFVRSFATCSRMVGA